MRAKDGVGRYGERVAAAYLSELGWSVLDRNWRGAGGELDIVAAEGPVLVVCEVKTRSSTAYGDPAEAVDHRKAARIRGLSRQWLDAQPRRWPEVRFDVVCVLRRRTGAAQVRHVRSAF